MPIVKNINLTHTRVDNFRFDPDGPKLQRLWDSQVRGLGLETAGSGRKSWIFRFRVGDKQRILTIGKVQDYDLDEARDRALELRSEVREGSDPKTLRSPQRDAPSVQDLYDEYTATRYYQTRSKDFHANFKSTMKRYVLPTIGHLSVLDVKRWQVRQIVDDLVEAGKEGMATGTLTHIRVLFNHAIDRELIERTPADRVRVKRTTSGRREKWLQSSQDLRRAWFLDAPIQIRALVRWALLTGCRRDEARTSLWEWIDSEAGAWRVPETKNRRVLVLPITDTMQVVLDEVRATFPDSPYLFPSTVNQKKELPRGTLDYIIRTHTGGAWSMHVLRHTVESWMADLGVAQEGRDMVLNHVRGSMSERYRHGLQLDTKREALEIWHSELMGVVDGSH